MEVPDELLELVEEAEGAKTQGNTKFKGSDHSAASAQYKHGCTLVDRVLKKGVLTGADKKAVQELKDACHLNLANCQLKLEDWEGAATECDVVLERGANRKALFRRGQARLKQERLEEALADLTKARDMLPSDEVVAGLVKEAEAKSSCAGSSRSRRRPQRAGGGPRRRRHARDGDAGDAERPCGDGADARPDLAGADGPAGGDARAAQQAEKGAALGSATLASPRPPPPGLLLLACSSWPAPGLLGLSRPLGGARHSGAAAAPPRALLGGGGAAVRPGRVADPAA